MVAVVTKVFIHFIWIDNFSRDSETKKANSLCDLHKDAVINS